MIIKCMEHNGVLELVKINLYSMDIEINKDVYQICFQLKYRSDSGVRGIE